MTGRVGLQAVGDELARQDLQLSALSQEHLRSEIGDATVLRFVGKIEIEGRLVLNPKLGETTKRRSEWAVLVLTDLKAHVLADDLSFSIPASRLRIRQTELSRARVCFNLWDADLEPRQELADGPPVDLETSGVRTCWIESVQYELLEAICTQ